MKECPKCKKQNIDEAEFCGFCGSTLSLIAFKNSRTISITRKAMLVIPIIIFILSALTLFCLFGLYVDMSFNVSENMLDFMMDYLTFICGKEGIYSLATYFFFLISIFFRAFVSSIILTVVTIKYLKKPLVLTKKLTIIFLVTTIIPTITFINCIGFFPENILRDLSGNILNDFARVFPTGIYILLLLFVLELVFLFLLNFKEKKSTLLNDKV